MPHVMMTADSVGGVWTYALEMIDALAERGVTTSLAVLGPAPSTAQWSALGATAVVDVAHHPGRLEWMPSPWDDVDDAAAWLVDLQRGWRPDVVHLNGFGHATADWTVPTVVVAHSDVVGWWQAVHGHRPGPDWDEYVRRVTAGLGAASAVVAPTTAALRATAAAFGGTGGTVVPNGRSDGWVTPSCKEPVVLAAGRLWDPAKGLTTLAAAAGAVPWPVLVAGDAGHGEGRSGEAPGGRGELVELGALAFDELSVWLRRAAVFAAPVRYEPFGLAVLEAALAGCALVLGDVPSLRELWGDAPVFVPPGDAVALGRALRDLAEDHAACAAAGAAARRIAAVYTPARMAAGYARIYSGLTERAVGRWTWTW